MKNSELETLELVLLTHGGQAKLARHVREMPDRLEKLLSLRSTELSNEALEAVLARLGAFREEIGAALANLPHEAQRAAETHHEKLARAVLTGLAEKSGETARQLAKKLDDGLRLLEKQAREAVAAQTAGAAAAIEAKFLQVEALFSRNLESLAAGYEKKRLALAREYEQQEKTRGAGILAETYRGNWSADVLYLRGETFSFRGGWHLVLKDARGQLPGNATLNGPGKVYALLAAPGAPGNMGLPGRDGATGSTYVPPPIVVATATRGQWTYSNGRMYWAVADGVVRTWVTTAAP